MTQGFLFEPEAPEFRTCLAAKLRALAAAGVYFGTSSWKYEGWLGQIYTEERYLTRGRFSSKLFEQACLAEYAETFPAVCGDFSFYQFPTPEFWAKLFGSAPRTLRFAFKVPEEITVRTFPGHPRYGARAGLANPAFLDAEMFTRLFAEPLAAYRDRVAALVFEFGTFPRTAYPDVEPFLMDLDPFLAKLPAGFRYSIEIRNPEFLTPLYFALLRDRGVAHVYNSWTRMPELLQQAENPAALTADFLVARALLKQGRVYEEAVKKFQPYRAVREPYAAARTGLRELVKKARETKLPAFLFVNNRLEGNAPETIAAVVDD